jgi:hypothetical protein
MTKIRTSSQKPWRTSGNDDRNELQEKNVSRTVLQPLLVTMAVASAPTTMMVETVAIVVSRRARRRRAASRAARRSTVVAGVLSGAARRHGEGEGRRTGERGAGAWPRS